MSSLFEKSISTLYGVGEKRSALFSRLGITTVGELLRFYPRTYEDFTTPVDINTLKAGDISCIKATLESPVVSTRISGGRLIAHGRVFDQTGFITITFFNNKYIDKMLSPAENTDFMAGFLHPEAVLKWYLLHFLTSKRFLHSSNLPRHLRTYLGQYRKRCQAGSATASE